MDSERWKKIEDVFQSALDLTGGEREEFLRSECAGDSELRREVERLIARYETAAEFLESPVWTDSLLMQPSLKQRIAVSLEDELPPAARREESAIGRQVGAYRLTEEIGRGGMGVVYAAERADGEFRQKVAVKLIKRGMDTDFIVKRFRHERQIAATLNHPNIARLFDGGTTTDGLPYFVLEFIEGEPFFRYGEKKKLGWRQKLELFLRVCAAVSHAHDKRIVHRDIKPGNILVAADGEPKLLDFGIAKILDSDLIHESVMPTATQMRLMTPEYASPEQARGDEITPASDQYSLGVLLYELLTGARPYKFPSRSAHDIARIICEEMPLEPSSGEFGKMLSGDPNSDEDFCRKLDRLVLKSLRKNPAERYASVKDFAADIERFLRGEPVLAESFAGETESLQVESKNAESVVPSVHQKSIAVLPFKILNTPSDAATDGGFLGIGLADALITRLSNVRRVVVRPTSSILSYGGRAFDSFTAGKELNVQFILDGNIIKTDSRIRVSVQLLNVAEQSTVWAERFDEKFTDVLELEDQISMRVAESIVPQMTTGEIKNLAKRGTDDAKAYEAYLRGRYHWNTFTENSFAQAFVAYHEAIAHDPDYALAYAGIADYYIWLGVYGIVPPKDCYPPAKDAAGRAVELDDSLADAYASLGFARLCGDYDWVEAEKNVARAVELNPNYPVAHLWHSYVSQTAGRFDEGIRQARRAVELDPLTYTNYHVLAWAYYFARQFDRAIEQAAENVKKFPGIGLAYFTQSWILRFLGRHEESLAASRRALELSGDSLFALLGHAQAFAAAGHRTQTGETLRRAFEQGERQYLSYYHVALVHAYAGEPEKALDALERAFEDREGWLIWLRSEPALDRLRREPRFVRLRKIVERRGIGAPAETVDSQAETLPFNQKSIAVLPFKLLNEVHSGDSDGGDFLGVGLADALITRLSNVRRFVVRPTSSVLRFGRGDAADSFAAGRELDVGYVLDGNILRAGERLRVSVQLLDVESRATVWAERFDENLTDFLSLEDVISTKVAGLLVSQLTTGEIEDLAKRATENAEAHAAYLRGRYHWSLLTDGAGRRAVEYYREAIELDPHYALPYAGIADYYVRAGLYDALPPKEAYPLAKEAARRAVALDDNLSEAYAALGLAELYGDYDRERSEKSIRRALELNPHSAVAHVWYSHVLFTQKQSAKAIEHIERAVELDSSFLNRNSLAWGFYYAHRYDEAVRLNDELAAQFPQMSFAHFSQSWFLRGAGRIEESLAAAEKALALAHGSRFAIYGHAQAQAAAGKRAEALEAVRRIEAQAAEQYVSFYHLAVVYLYLEMREAMYQALDRALIDREGVLIWIGVSPTFDRIKNEPRFIEFLRRIDSTGQIVSESVAIPAAQTMRTAERIVITRRAGIKQGAFLVIVSFLLLPILVALVASIEFLTPVHLFLVFLLVFGGGLTRIIYALFFEPKSAFAPGDSSPDLNVSFSSRPTEIIEANRTDANNFDAAGASKRRLSKRSVLYALATISLLAFGYGLYHIISHSKIDLSATPPEESWKNNFAAKMSAKRLTTLGKARQAIISPDGASVAYTFEDAGRRSLWIRPTNSENARQLIAPDAVFYTELKFSPGGDYVYYIASRPPARTLYRVPANGGAPEKISGGVLNLFALAPDGRRIVYDSRNADNNQHSLFIAELDENSRIKSARTLVVLEVPNYFPGGIAFAPDGEKIVYPRSVIENNREVLNLFVYDLATNRNERLGDKNFDRINATEWRRHGEEIVISAKESDSATHQLWVVAYPSGEFSRLTNDFTNYYGVSLTADSATLATTKLEFTSDIWTSELAASNVNFDSKTKQITTGVDRQDGFNGVSWTQDGRILYTTGAGAERGISLMNADGTNDRLIPTGALDPKFPTLTSDHRFLIYADKKGQELNIWRFDMTAGIPAQVSSRYAVTPAVSPDNRSMVYAMPPDPSSNRLVIHRQPLAGGEETKLTSETSVRPVVSPDGGFVACNYAGDETNKIWQIAVLPMEAGAAPKLIQPYKNNFFISPQERPLAWSPDGRFLYFLNNADNNIANIFRVAVEGDAAPVQMTHFTSGEIFDFAIAPEGNRAVLARGSTLSDVVIFKNSK